MNENNHDIWEEILKINNEELHTRNNNRYAWSAVYFTIWFSPVSTNQGNVITVIMLFWTRKKILSNQNSHAHVTGFKDYWGIIACVWELQKTPKMKKSNFIESPVQNKIGRIEENTIMNRNEENIAIDGMKAALFCWYVLNQLESFNDISGCV